MSLEENRFEERLVELEAALGYTFRERALLARALTHRSYANERQGGIPDNERLEFLGDAVLELLVSQALFDRYQGMKEGALSRARANVVKSVTLARVAAALGLGEMVRLGRGETATGGRRKASLMADALEAVLAAVYLDGGLAAAGLVAERLLAHLWESKETLLESDPKSLLQELLQEHGRPSPRYEVVGEVGPEHAKEFEVEVSCEQRLLGRGRGVSKKEAARAAAINALDALQEPPETAGPGQ